MHAPACSLTCGLRGRMIIGALVPRLVLEARKDPAA